MTKQGWREAVLKAQHDDVLLELLARLLSEQDAAKAALAEAGFGCTGTPWPEVVEEIREFRRVRE